MGEDMRVDLLRARRQAIGCTWLFLAFPGVLGIIVVATSGGSSVLGWVLVGIFLVGTAYLVSLWVRAPHMKVSQGRVRSSWFGRGRFQ
jgi:hypothetical protein